MSRRRCCCEECLIFTDDFDRANSETVSGWTEKSGDWSILSDQLHVDGAGLIIVYTYRARLSWLVGATPGVAGPIDGGKYRIVANYLNDGSYQYAEFYFTTTSLTISLYGPGGLLKEKVYAVNLVGAADVSMGLFLEDDTYEEDVFYGWVNVGSAPSTTYLAQAWCNLAITPAGYKFGLGSGSAVPIDFDNFNAYETAATNPECPSDFMCVRELCTGWAWSAYEGGSIAGYFVGDLCFEIASTDCPGLNEVGILYQISEHAWQATAAWGQIDFWCDQNFIGPNWYDKYFLMITATYADCGLVPSSEDPSATSCDPFSMTWDGYYDIGGDPEASPCEACVQDDAFTIEVFCCSENYMLYEDGQIMLFEDGQPMLYE